MQTKQVTGILDISLKEVKELRNDLNQVVEFRNQLTLDQKTFDSNSKIAIKSIGKANYLLELLQFISKDHRISYIKENGKLKTVQVVKL